MEKITIPKLMEMKKNHEPITMITAYDYPLAALAEEAGIEILLVGDSLGMVKLGYENTLPVTMDDIVYHSKIVSRAARRALVVADMPFMSYEIDCPTAVANAGRLIKEGGAAAVKIEGGLEVARIIKAIIAAKIPVMGHIGLTPQAINQLGGYKVQGKTPESAENLITAAKILEGSGVFAIVLECLPRLLAKEITEKVSVPTIGIGAGVDCDGQVLVSDDALGLFSEFKPKFVKRYASLRSEILQAFQQYHQEVKSRKFPDEEHSY